MWLECSKNSVVLNKVKGDHSAAAFFFLIRGYVFSGKQLKRLFVYVCVEILKIKCFKYVLNISPHPVLQNKSYPYIFIYREK